MAGTKGLVSLVLLMGIMLWHLGILVLQTYLDKYLSSLFLAHDLRLAYQCQFASKAPLHPPDESRASRGYYAE
jgi:hypothetical protein